MINVNDANEIKVLQPGAIAQVSAEVNEENTALKMGSGSLEVFATPAAVALIEKAACKLLKPYLEDGVTTVGTRICIDHVSATPLGCTVTATAELTEIDGRRYVFSVRADDENGEIVRGTHERFAVRSDRFMEKTINSHKNLNP